MDDNFVRLDALRLVNFRATTLLRNGRPDAALRVLELGDKLHRQNPIPDWIDFQRALDEAAVKDQR